MPWIQYGSDLFDNVKMIADCFSYFSKGVVPCPYLPFVVFESPLESDQWKRKKYIQVGDFENPVDQREFEYEFEIKRDDRQGYNHISVCNPLQFTQGNRNIIPG